MDGGVNCSAFLGLASLCACAVRREKTREEGAVMRRKGEKVEEGKKSKCCFYGSASSSPVLYVCQCLCICTVHTLLLLLRNICTVCVHVLQEATSNQQRKRPGPPDRSTDTVQG